MVTARRVGYGNEHSTYLYRYNIIAQSPNEEVEHFFFCSVCNHHENDMEFIRDQMTFVHDIPSEEFVTEHFSGQENVRFSIHKIVEPSSVLFVEVYKNGYLGRSSVRIVISVTVPFTVFTGVSTPETLSGKENSTSESCDVENGSWNENDASEEYVGAMDTMSISPDFLEGGEHAQSVFSFALSEGNKPLTIFKDKDCEELAYPGIFCGEARAENDMQHVPVYYSDICKSELWRANRRASMCVENLFFKVKKLQMKILLGKSQVVSFR